MTLEELQKRVERFLSGRDSDEHEPNLVGAIEAIVQYIIERDGGKNPLLG